MISTLCVPNMQYQFVNPTTQVALFSLCIGTCPPISNITWRVYHGHMNSSTNAVLWTAFNQSSHYYDTWFFGNFFSAVLPLSLRCSLRMEHDELHVGE